MKKFTDTLQINTKENLLAFSAGIDSSALFFILLEQNIPFDIAIVNYNIRTQAKDEVKYAQYLAKQYNKKCHVKELSLDVNSNFEKNARDIRYKFFEDLIMQYNYKSLITAHQLNDKLEWFLMQLTRGSGLSELIGLEAISQKKEYMLLRPLLAHSKEELKEYLDSNNKKYFIDITNKDERFRRNYFRANFSDALLKEFKDGISNSFNYLQNDLNSLNIEKNPIFKDSDLEIFLNAKDDNKNIKVIDKSLKKRGLLISKNQRDEIIKQKAITISDKISISITDTHIWISPKSKAVMDKKFKDKCRVENIPKNIRAYLFEVNCNIKNIIL